jgi:membrane fusion protein
MKLFREEARHQQSAQWLGTVRLARPLSFAAVTAGALAILVLVAAFALLGEVTRKARLTGMLVATEGSLNVAAQQSGVVLERRVREGDQVRRGDTLLAINTDRQSLSGSAVASTVVAMAEQVRKREQLLRTARGVSLGHIGQQRRIALEKIDGIEAELVQLENALGLQQRKVALTRQEVERLQGLVAEGYIPESKLQEKREAELDALSELQSLKRNSSTLQRERMAVRADIEALDAQLANEQNTIDTQLSSLKQEELDIEGRRSLVITAPCDGTVSSIEIKPGQSVAVGQTLLTLLPKARNGKALEAQLFAPSRTAGFVQPGQGVYIRYAAYPFQKFGMYAGRITAVSGTPFFPNELPPNLSQQLLSQAGSVEGLYRISVELDDQSIRAYGKQVPLKPGFVLEADVVQARLKIWEMMFEPLLAIRASMAATLAPPAPAGGAAAP